MGCSHDHHHEARATNQKRLLLALLLAAGYMVAETVGGWLTHSLALLADAGHLLSDVGALGLSLFALWIAHRPPTSQRTFGYYRAEILAALTNGALLIAIAVIIFVEAYQRLRLPGGEVHGGPMLAVAAGGLVVNLLGLKILGHDRHQNLNMRGAWLHVLTDALGSVGAMIAAGLIWALGWYWADPVASALIGLLVIYSAWRLVGEAVQVLMEAAPHGIDVDKIRDAIMGVAGVLETHDLHVWTITSGLESLSAHVVIDDGQPHELLLTQLRTLLHQQFRIDHLTIQLEPPDFDERLQSVCR